MRRNLLSRLGRNLTRWISFPQVRSMRRRIESLEVAVEYLLSGREFVVDPSKAFNGQAGRQKIFEAIVNEGQFQAIVETGTCLGETTGWLNHVTGLPIYSSEINRFLHLIAARRLVSKKSIQLKHGDSVDFLRDLAVSQAAGQRIFFYLDAHGYESLPLAEELRLIASHWHDFVVMVDDFEVPGDGRYGFDDYGFGRALNMRCFGKVFHNLGLVPYSPCLPALQETGARSGYVLLARAGSGAAQRLDALALLRRASA
jgi:hypothetical protein